MLLSHSCTNHTYIVHIKWLGRFISGAGKKLLYLLYGSGSHPQYVVGCWPILGTGVLINSLLCSWMEVWDNRQRASVVTAVCV